MKDDAAPATAIKDARNWLNDTGDAVSGVTGLPKTGNNDANAKPPFEQWMRNVDKYCYAIAGISIHDLEDCPFRDWYDSGVSERSAASRCIKRAREN